MKKATIGFIAIMLIGGLIYLPTKYPNLLPLTLVGILIVVFVLAIFYILPNVFTLSEFGMRRTIVRKEQQMKLTSTRNALIGKKRKHLKFAQQ